MFKKLFRRWACKHEYKLLCTGENSMGTYHFCQCNKCGKNKIESV